MYLHPWFPFGSKQTNPFFHRPNSFFLNRSKLLFYFTCPAPGQNSRSGYSIGSDSVFRRPVDWPRIDAFFLGSLLISSRMGQQRRRARRSESVQGYRRIYDPRRWHTRSSGSGTKNVANWGQPPTGWMLVWAGQFKRWRRRWFVAHPPGLLLHYKNSEQVGRPGCISLLGATATPTPGKERQMKIVRGSMVYYLRTVTKDYRQAWLNAIHESIRIYNKSVQKAAIGATPGASLLPQQSLPEHVKEEWEAQERELNRRLAERMEDLEQPSQAFLQQLQSLQQSLSVIQGALGFCEKPKPKVAVSTSDDVKGPERGVSAFKTVDARSFHGARASSVDEGFRRFTLPETGGSDSLPGGKSLLTSAVSLPESSILRSQRSILKWKPDSEHKQGEGKGNCEGVKLQTSGARELGESPIQSGKGDGFLQNDTSVVSKNGESRLLVDGSEKLPGKDLIGDPGGVLESEKQGVIHRVALNSSIEGVEKSGPEMQGPLHAAWHRMHEAFAEALKVEIHRALELEAENAVLQESLVLLPQLKKDHTDLLNLRESLQSSGSYTVDEPKTRRNIDGEDADDEADGHDTDEEIAILRSDLADEEYFEALEVLNKHDFISKLTTNEEQEGYSDRDDSAHEPSEEGDVPADAELLSEAEGDDLEQPRTRLPAPRPLSRGFSLWTVLKNAIGKDLNHITLPATINEPLSVLQKCAEEMQYRYLLERAGEEDSSLVRLLYVSTFACASYHGSIYRDAKPFNPLLGETYEWLAPDEKSWFLTEQVSHHPPIMAFHSESSVGDYKIYGEIEIKNKFWGKSVEVLPTGLCHLRFGKYGDHFTWKKVTTCAHNVVVGKLWIDNYGELVIKNHTTGDVSRVRFHKAGSKDQCRITGKVYNSKGVPQFSISGNYQDQILSTPAYQDFEGSGRGATVLWRSVPEIDDFQQQYCFSTFSIGLNELTTKLAEIIPPTDSRFRPDQRALEDGDLEKATPEKLRLEEKQRDARKLRNATSQDWQPLWFEQRQPGVWQVQTSDDGGEPSWVYQGKYWEARQKQRWQNCPDIM